MPSPRRNDARRPEPSRARQGSEKQPRDAGAYIGRLPERESETIPDGLGPKDERVSAVATQPGTVRGPEPAEFRGEPPEGHREAEPANDDRIKEAGENR
jgi:hypothetical protein